MNPNTTVERDPQHGCLHHSQTKRQYHLSDTDRKKTLYRTAVLSSVSTLTQTVFNGNSVTKAMG